MFGHLQRFLDCLAAASVDVAVLKHIENILALRFVVQS
jgi:hypothetical protein